MKGLLYRHIEPELDTRGNEVDGEEEQDGGGQQRQGHKSNNESCSQVGADRMPSSIVKQFYQIAENKEDNKDQQQQVDVYQDKHQNCIGYRNIRTKADQACFDKRQQPDEAKHARNDQKLAFAPPPFIFRVGFPE